MVKERLLYLVEIVTGNPLKVSASMRDQVAKPHYLEQGVRYLVLTQEERMGRCPSEQIRSSGLI